MMKKDSLLFIMLVMLGTLVFTLGHLTNIFAIPANFYLRPRSLQNIPAIMISPLIHADWEHWFGNIVVLIPMSIGIYLMDRKNSFLPLAGIYFTSSFLVWLLGKNGTHIGISGVAIGYSFFIFLTGIFTLDKVKILFTIIVVSTHVGIFANFWRSGAGISDDAHLLGFLTALLFSFLIYKPLSREVYKKN